MTGSRHGTFYDSISWNMGFVNIEHDSEIEMIEKP